MKKVAEISTHEDRRRLQPVIEELALAGVPLELDTLIADEQTLEGVLHEACAKYDQIRIGGLLCGLAPSLSPRMPTIMLSLKAADAFVKQHGQWWPRNYLTDGISRALITDGHQLDLTGAVFILGTNCEARALVASLVRVGFSRFSISDLDDERGQTFVADLRASYFRVQFQFVSRHLITQLPSVHTVAVNTLNQGSDDGALRELYYFNFLSPGGIWLDLSLSPPNTELEAEAHAVDARVESGYRAAAWTDREWAAEAFGVELDVEALARRLTLIYAEAELPTDVKSDV